MLAFLSPFIVPSCKRVGVRSLISAVSSDASSAKEQQALSQVAETSLNASALDILHVGDGYVAVNKPSGMIVHRSESLSPHERMFAVEETQRLLVSEYGVTDAVRVVHRLDRATSGVMVFALGDSERAAQLQSALQNSSVSIKQYWALIRCPEDVTLQSEWFNDHPLKNISKSKSSAPQPARTDFRKLLQLRIDQYSPTHGHDIDINRETSEPNNHEPHSICVVSAQLSSGRRHQIRRHLSNSRLPILGDTTYGKGRYNRDARVRYGLSRLALHSRRLTFREPGVSDQDRPVTFEASVPADLLQALERIPGFDSGQYDQQCDLRGGVR